MPHPFLSYEIRERIAVGGMAEVFKAIAYSPNGNPVPVVIKKILPQYAGNQSFRDLFVTEARIAAKLRHPNIVRMLDLGRMDRHLFITLEFIDGGDLWEITEHLNRLGSPISLSEAMYVASETLKGLHHAHTAPEQVVHRDLSPANVMISRTGSVKVTDFGIANSRFRGMQTVRGVLRGNVRYMAPEQITCEDEIDARTDVYQVGLLLWTLLAGRHPFQSLKLGEAIDRTVRGDIPRLETIVEGVPPAVSLAIATAMERLPDLRFASALEFQQALAEVAARSGITLNGDALAIRMTDFRRDGEPSEPPQRVVSRKSFTEKDGSLFTSLGEDDEAEPPRSEPTPTPTPTTLPGVRLDGHEGEVGSLAVTPDGMLAMTGSADRTARVWDLVSQRELRLFRGHGAAIAAVDVSSGGAVGASAAADGELRVWHVDSGELVWSTQAHEGAANALVIASDGRLALTGGEDGLVKVWDLVAERCTAVLRTEAPVTSLALHPTARIVAVGQRDGMLRIFDVARRQERSAMRAGKEPVRAVAMEASGSIALGASGTTVAVCRPSSDRVTLFERHKDAVCAVAIASAALAVSAGTTGTIRLWSVRDTSEVRTFKAHERPVLALRVLADGSLFSASADGSIGVWQIPNVV